jgi:hypothetical protein
MIDKSRKTAILKALNTSTYSTDRNRQQLGCHYYGKYWEWSYKCNIDMLTQKSTQVLKCNISI